MKLSAAQIQGVLRQAGWSESLIVTMTAIALAESGGDPNNVNPVRPDYSVGLWQINMLAHGTRYGTESQLKDPLTNARAALAIYRTQGLHAWSTYTYGKYKSHLAASQAAYSQGAGAAPAPAPAPGGVSPYGSPYAPSPFSLAGLSSTSLLWLIIFLLLLRRLRA